LKLADKTGGRGDVSRRGVLAGAALLAPALLVARAYGQTDPTSAGIKLGEPMPFDPNLVRERARQLANAPYQPPDQDFPAVLAELNYEQHRDIRFRPPMSLWRDLNVDAEAQFFHLGYGFRDPVHIYEVADGQQREVLYSPDLFDYGKNTFQPDFSEHLGFAGFRLHVPLNRPDYLDELIVFLGASYFRALGRGQRYGLSARGIAVDTGLPSGEEFPLFREFWLERPVKGENKLTLHALLDGESLTGAYTFVIRAGAMTTITINSVVFPRRTIDLLGVAPLTSMYLFGAADRQGVDDFRPEVHDSQGLQVWTGGGEWMWRPLTNPNVLKLSIYRDENPRGFGLLQRNREFDDYQDLESRYELRPSLWVEPSGPWGPGQVGLIELPTDQEIQDNIVAFWAPERPVEAGSEQEFNYRLYWCRTPPERPDLAEVAETRIGAGGVPGKDYGADNRRKFVIDFAGGQLTDLPPDAGVQPVVSASKGEVTPPIVQKNEVSGGWRLFFDYLPVDGGPVEFRAYLQLQDNVLTETWTFQWTG
jgi:periplasmic glucans biosynthesis protein